MDKTKCNHKIGLAIALAILNLAVGCTVEWDAGHMLSKEKRSEIESITDDAEQSASRAFGDMAKVESVDGAYVHHESIGKKGEYILFMVNPALADKVMAAVKEDNPLRADSLFREAWTVRRALTRTDQSFIALDIVGLNNVMVRSYQYTTIPTDTVRADVIRLLDTIVNSKDNPRVMVTDYPFYVSTAFKGLESVDPNIFPHHSYKDLMELLERSKKVIHTIDDYQRRDIMRSFIRNMKRMVESRPLPVRSIESRGTMIQYGRTPIGQYVNVLSDFRKEYFPLSYMSYPTIDDVEEAVHTLLMNILTISIDGLIPGNKRSFDLLTKALKAYEEYCFAQWGRIVWFPQESLVRITIVAYLLEDAAKFDRYRGFTTEKFIPVASD